ncbi:MAG: anthranilate synthase component I [Gammaproteobacteria bacterium]|nr:anthranilate synthase component I [Gammaproteobacteria bacterium]
MSREQFDAFAAQGYNRVPLIREVYADLDTPLSVYLRFAQRPFSYLFESVQGGEKWGRYSIIGLPCRHRLEVRGHEVAVFEDERRLELLTCEDPLAFVDEYRERYQVAPVAGLPKFTGGLVGYFGYDTVRYVEPRLGECPNPDPIGSPDILLMLSEEVIVFDNLSGKLYLIVHADPHDNRGWNKAQLRLNQLVEQLLQHPVPRAMLGARTGELGEVDFVSEFTQAGFEAAVRKAKEYITAGDAMQVVLSQRMTVPFEAAPMDLYRALRSLNPSPYMYFMDLGDHQVVGSSPEILVRLEDGMVTVRPIAGTRPRGATDEQDQALEKDLLSDPKELAEHLMLIDLGRNDVGRVAKTGSVKVTAKMVIERYSHVMHIVSNVVGEVRADHEAMDVIRATFPAGTVSGAPKVRAMEIIDELEPVKRGIYSGAVGYIGWHGNVDTAIAIRTAVIKDGKLYLQAGAGVVYDSDPTKEWEETMNKGRAVFRAAALAAQGLDYLAQGHK